MAVVRMKLSDVIKMDCCDFCHMNIKCDKCKRVYVLHSYLGTGEYIAEHTARARCKSYLTYTTADVLDLKEQDPQFEDILQSLMQRHDLPIVGIKDDEIVDGLHRLSAARLLGLRYILVEDTAASHSQDSGLWFINDDIIPIPSKEKLNA